MTKLLFTLLLLWSYGLPFPAHAAPSYAATTSAAAEDGTGTVWALPDFSHQDGTIRRWQSGAWVNVAVPETHDFRLLALTRSADGNVYGLWHKSAYEQNTPTPCLVTTQRGTGIRTLARFNGAVMRDYGALSTPGIYAGPGGDVWIVASAPMLWHITPDGAVQTFPFQADWYTDGKLPDGYESSAYQTPSLGSVAVGAKRRLFWETKMPFGPRNSLRGLLLWDGKTLSPAPALTGTAGEEVSRLFPLDANHVWMAVDQDQMNGPHTAGALYRLDTRTFHAVREPVPAALLSTVQIFQAGGDWYLVEAGQYNAVPPVLWRKQDGVWRKEIAPLEEPGGYYTSDHRDPWLAEPAGLWLGASGGAWWLPPGKSAPLWVNWRRGLPAQPISGLFPLPGGRMLTFGQNLDSTELPATPQPVRPLPPGVSVGGLGAPPNLMRPFADPRQHIWSAQIYYTQTPSLEEWDGRQWRTYAVPKTITGITGLYAADTLGRIWVETRNWHPPTQPQPVEGRAVYDPARDTWTSYATTQDALAAAAARPGMAFLPRHDFYQPPVFSGDGRVAYVDNNTQIFLYDGIWRHWEARDILASYQYGNLPDPPHFNAAGHLEVALPAAYWEWTPGTHWQLTGTQRDTRDPNPVPPGGPGGLPSDPPRDSLGVQWFVSRNTVYTAGYGLWAKQPELSAPGSPFALGFGIEDVLRDPAGRLFFVSRPTGRYEMVVWSPPPVPKPTVSVTPVSEDSVSVRFSSALSGPHWFLWRLNGGAWSAPTTAKTLALSALPRGDYRLEVQALDSRLQVSPAAVTVWSVRVAPETQIARWVSVLSAGPDDAREAAVTGLVKQPAAALPALKAARPGATDLGKWWIDAAIQEIRAGETPKIAN